MKQIKIDLKGHTIISDNDVTIKQNLKDSKLIITDSSAEKTGRIVNTKNAEDAGIAVWARLGDVEINGGTIENNSNYEATLYVGTSPSKLDGANPTIVVNGGVIKNNAEGEYHWKADTKPLNLNVINSMSPNNIVVKGGIFNNQNPMDGDDNMGGSFLADGAEVVETENGFEVK